MAKDKKYSGKKSYDDDDEIEEDGAAEEAAASEVQQEPDAPATPPPAAGTEHGGPVLATGPRTVKVAGEGTMSLMIAGKPHTVERGKKVTVSPELYEALKAHGETVEEEEPKA